MTWWSSCLLLSPWNLRFVTLELGVNLWACSDSADVDDDMVASESEVDGFSCRVLPAPVASVSSRLKSSSSVLPELPHRCWWCWVICVCVISCFWTWYTRCSSWTWRDHWTISSSLWSSKMCTALPVCEQEWSCTCCLNVCSCLSMAILMCSFSILISARATTQVSVRWPGLCVCNK